MITNQMAAQLACLDIYDPITPGVFHQVIRVGETVCGTTLIDGTFYIVNQGTETAEGWEADFDAEPIAHPVLGQLHSGFDKNLPALMVQLLATIPLNAPVIVTGHSKGAAEGAILAARLTLACVHVTRCILFACPNAGFAPFANWLNLHVPGVSYRNAPSSLSFFGDPVPLVPTSPYVPPYPHTKITEIPDGLDRLISVMWHEGKYYARAFEQQPSPNATKNAANNE